MPADDEQEVFEVVDEENKTVGTQPRGVCHAEGLRHRAVYCLVFDPDGSLLLQQRSERWIASQSFTGLVARYKTSKQLSDYPSTGRR